MNILMIGDIVGRPGRKAVEAMIEKLIKNYQVNFVMANGENAAGGVGITKSVALDLFHMGIDVLTMGNHVWDKKEIFDFIDQETRIIRPLNYPGYPPGKGSGLFSVKNSISKIAVINISGRVFMHDLDCPFRAVDEEINKLKKTTPIIIVDFHAEATSEKIAMGWYLDGKVTAVIGTHTHVQTADERILPERTAFITDVGMTGPCNSVIGVKKDLVIEKFLTQMPTRFSVANGDMILSAVVIETDANSGEATNIRRIFEHLPE